MTGARSFVVLLSFAVAPRIAVAQAVPAERDRALHRRHRRLGQEALT